MSESLFYFFPLIDNLNKIDGILKEIIDPS